MSNTFFEYEPGTSRVATLERPGPDEIRIRDISATQWRVSNKCSRADDPLGLLGFIERLDDEFEVMELGAMPGDFAWFTFSSFAEASAHFVCDREPGVTARSEVTR